jgi:hypothetical protein
MKTPRRLSAILCAILVSAALHGQETQDGEAWQIPATKEKFHIFLLMGQSNMSGHAPTLPEDLKPVPHVVKLPTVGEIKWVPAAHPLHNRLDSDRFGLGLPFAVQYLKDHPGVVVGLIPVAWGGDPIDQLKKGTGVYADAIKKAHFAMSQGVIKGVLWHQGESDTVQQAETDSYENKLHQLVADLRHDLGDDQLPFIAGNLAEFYGTGPAHNAPDRVKRINEVRGVLRALPQQVPFTGFVESTGCSSEDENMVHFDRKSYILLGQRYAKVLEEVEIKNEKPSPL